MSSNEKPFKKQKLSPNEEVLKHLQIPLQELSDATNGFSDTNFLAKGGFGKVYKGVSVKHGNIAIKILDPGLGQGEHEFETEIALLSVYKHENIVSLLGFCDEDGKKILVYKHESNGSLDQHLSREDLTWIQRLQICLDAARGLQYLHDDVEPHLRILHRDIKSSNILLDENWKAKISDFGLSRIGPANVESTFLISNACGTIGYTDPEYMTTGYLTQKSDIYSFGVVLFEVLCGRLTRVIKYKDERRFLSNLITIYQKRKSLEEIIYHALKRQISKASFLTFSNIAYQCLMRGNERPTIKKVVEQLQKALDDQLAPSDSLSDDGYLASYHQGQLRSAVAVGRGRSATIGKKKTSKRMISYEEICKNFGKTMDNAAKNLAVSRSTLKRVCRNLGIPRWPYETGPNKSDADSFLKSDQTDVAVFISVGRHTQTPVIGGSNEPFGSTTYC